MTFEEIRKQAVKPLILTQGDEDNDFRESVVKILGKIRDAEAVEPIIQALKDEDINVREKAVWALGKIGDKRATLAKDEDD